MSEFDWVEARSNCTVQAVFEQLAKDAQSDLKRHETLNPGLVQYQRFKACSEDIVYVEWPGVHRVVF